MQWEVLNKIAGQPQWVVIAQFRWSLDAQDFIDNMVQTRGYREDNFRIAEVAS